MKPFFILPFCAVLYLMCYGRSHLWIFIVIYFRYSSFECLVGADYLDRLGYLDFDVWYNILALVCFNLGFLFLAYVNLRLLKKEK